mmetsp:Transcript_78080/g.232570  ORF Transcript_78080/g.232570 Transcript_78080/m.232570 type:complete len:229 (+) Transcript_78080:633-1319(+)
MPHGPRGWEERSRVLGAEVLAQKALEPPGPRALLLRQESCEILQIPGPADVGRHEVLALLMPVGEWRAVDSLEQLPLRGAQARRPAAGEALPELAPPGQGPEVCRRFRLLRQLARRRQETRVEVQVHAFWALSPQRRKLCHPGGHRDEARDGRRASLLNWRRQGLRLDVGSRPPLGHRPNCFHAHALGLQHRLQHPELRHGGALQQVHLADVLQGLLLRCRSGGPPRS